MASRTEAREGFNAPVRIALLENDVDELDRDMAQLKGLINRVIWALVTATITMGTASILLAANLVASH